MNKIDRFREFFNDLTPRRQQQYMDYHHPLEESFKKLEISVFGGIKTTKEKEAIVNSEFSRLCKLLDKTTKENVEICMKAILKDKGVEGLSEYKELFESLLPKEELNAIYLKCRK